MTTTTTSPAFKTLAALMIGGKADSHKAVLRTISSRQRRKGGIKRGDIGDSDALALLLESGLVYEDARGRLFFDDRT